MATQILTLPPQPILTMPLQARPVAPLTINMIRSLPLNAGEQAAIQLFMKEHPDCATVEQLSRFLQLAKAARWRGVDMKSVLRTLGLGGTIHMKGKGSVSNYRVAGMEFSEETVGSRGRRKDVSLPSLLWHVATLNCRDFDALNIGIQRVMEGTYGLTVPQDIPLIAPSGAAPSSVEVNQALSEFFAAHPECQAKQKSIYQLLNLIDSHQLVAQDVYALFRTFGLERHLPSLPPSGGWRSAGLSISPATAPLRGRELERQAFKISLLWGLLSNYCGQMDSIVEEMTNILSGHISASQLGQPGPLSEVMSTMATQRPLQSVGRGRAGYQQAPMIQTVTTQQVAPAASMRTTAMAPTQPAGRRGRGQRTTVAPTAAPATSFVGQFGPYFFAPGSAVSQNPPGAAFAPAGVRRN